MRKTTIILFGLMMTLLAACSSDDATEPQQITLDIPVEIYSSSSKVNVRAADQGDPGNDVVFKAPLYLYVYAYVAEEQNQHEVLVQTFTFKEDELAATWNLQDANTVNERWRKNVRVTFNISREFDNTTLGSSRVFAIASRTDLSKVLPQQTDITSKSTMADLAAITADFTSITSNDLKDIYSTPANDKSNPVVSTDNGIIVQNATTKALTCSTVELYHVAAKVDFTWEVPASLRKTVALEKIECQQLPTTCKVFEPTSNQKGTATCTVLGVSKLNPVNEVNDGNKWIGRAYAYVLQPPSPGTISYEVTFTTVDRQNTKGSITPESDVYSNVFTGWYRVVANIKE